MSLFRKVTAFRGTGEDSPFTKALIVNLIIQQIPERRLPTHKQFECMRFAKSFFAIYISNNHMEKNNHTMT